jgi:hypothetical protein
MRINTPSRRVSIVTVCAVLFLAFMVLGWGTGYKMSLYHRPGSVSSSIPVAKLLSQKERPSTTRAAEGILPQSPNHQPSVYYSAVVIAAILFGLQLSVPTWMREVAMDDSGRQRSAHSNFSFPPSSCIALFQLDSSLIEGISMLTLYSRRRPVGGGLIGDKKLELDAHARQLHTQNRQEIQYEAR